MQNAGISPEAVPRKGGKKQRNRINRNTDGFVARNKGLKNERDHKRCSLWESRRSEEKHPQETITPCRPGDRSLAGASQEGSVEQVNEIVSPIKVRNVKLPFAHAAVKASPLRFDPLSAAGADHGQPFHFRPGPS